MSDYNTLQHFPLLRFLLCPIPLVDVHVINSNVAMPVQLFNLWKIYVNVDTYFNIEGGSAVEFQRTSEARLPVHSSCLTETTPDDGTVCSVHILQELTIGSLSKPGPRRQREELGKDCFRISDVFATRLIRIVAQSSSVSAKVFVASSSLTTEERLW